MKFSEFGFKNRFFLSLRITRLSITPAPPFPHPVPVILLALRPVPFPVRLLPGQS